jgi:hypothetical protein
MLSVARQSRIYRVTQDAVRSLLWQKHPELFSLPSSVVDGRFLFETADNKLLGKDNNPSKDDKIHGVKHFRGALDKLAVLNGYEKVKASQIKCGAALSEGVGKHIVSYYFGFGLAFNKHSTLLFALSLVAVQNGKLMQNYTIYYRPHHGNLHAERQSVHHPPFCEEDFTLYRILENRLDDYINNKKGALIKYIKNSFFVKALRGVGIKFLPLDSSLSFRDMSDENSQPKESDDQPKDVSNSLEDILILHQGKLLVMENVPPDYRLVALPPVMTNTLRSPYKLKHNTASTIIYVSFVTFGAIPLAYRSIRYALDYPAMVEVLLASFIGTCAYSIWYSRYGARVRQQLSIERAIGSRIIARDDTALTYLVEGAVANVTNLVLREYVDRLGENDKSKIGVKIQGVENFKEMRKRLGTINLDPTEIAKELGLLVQSEGNSDVLIARSVSDVI